MAKYVPEAVQCLKVEQVATYLGISRSLAYQLIRQKGFPCIRISGRFVIPRERFLEWVDKQLKL